MSRKGNCVFIAFLIVLLVVLMFLLSDKLYHLVLSLFILLVILFFCSHSATRLYLVSQRCNSVYLIMFRLLCKMSIVVLLFFVHVVICFLSSWGIRPTMIKWHHLIFVCGFSDIFHWSIISFLICVCSLIVSAKVSRIYSVVSNGFLLQLKICSVSSSLSLHLIHTLDG